MRCLLLSVVLLVMFVLIAPAKPTLASDGWCDSDPILIIRTPAGRLVPVFVNVGARDVLFTPNTLVSTLVMNYTATPADGGTATSVTLRVTVPPSLLNRSFATRDIVSTGAFGTGIVYAVTHGVSGETLTSTFQLSVS